MSAVVRPSFLSLTVLARALAAPAFAASIAAAPLSVQAQTQTQIQPPAELRSYSIAAGPLEDALNSFGRTAGITLSFVPDATAGLRSGGLRGSHSVGEGLTRLLSGSGLEAVRQPNGSYLLRRMSAQATAQDASLSEIQVRAHTDRVPPPAAGGQVASGARLGLLGNVGVMETPFNVTSYTAKLIEDQQARGLMDVLENDPSVRSSAPIDSEADIVMVRGFEMFGREVLINGMAGLADNRGHVLEAVDRVEVMKGPSALLNSISPWGSSTGGSVNYVLKRAEDDPVTRFTGSYASSSQLGGHLDVGRRYGERQQYGVRLNTAYRDGDGAIDNTANRIGVAALALDYRGDKLRLTADAGYQEKKLEGGVGASRIGGSVAIPRAPKASTNFKQPWETFESDNRYLTLGLEYDLAPDWMLSASHGASLSNEVYLLTVHSIANAKGDLTGTAYWIPGRSTNESSELTLRGKFQTGAVSHSLVVNGADGEARRGQTTVAVGAAVPSNLYAPVIHPYRDGMGLSTDVDMLSRYSRTSVAATDTLGMFDERLFVIAGARRQKIDNRSYSANPVTHALTQTFRYAQDKVTPAVGLVVMLDKRLSVYVNYIESLQPGPTPSTYYANSNQVFQPFPSQQYEAGVKYQREHLTITSSVYQINLQNSIEIPSTSTTDVRPTLALDGEQRNRGLEVNVFGVAAPGVRLLGGVSLIDARLLHTQGGLTDGRRARGVPKKNLNLGSEWDVTMLPGATLTARVVYTDSAFIDTTNTAARSAPSWTRFDLGARYALKVDGKQVVLRANVDNVANRDYWSSASRGVLVLGAPRSVRLSVSTDL